MHRQRMRFYFVQSLTLGRFPLIFIFLLIILVVDTRTSGEWFLTTLAALILAAVTDLFDGYFARRFNVTSRLGAYADPLMDKLYYIVTFPTLVYLAGVQQESLHARLLLALAVLFILRDQWVSFLRSIGALYQVDAKANWVGKTRTLLAFPIICIIYYQLQAPRHWAFQIPITVAYALETVMLIVNLFSMWTYTRYYWPWLKMELQPGEQFDHPV